MATITPVTTSDAGRVTCTWSSMAVGDVGGSVEIYAYPKVTIQVIASSGGSVSVEGSNDNSNWYGLFYAPTGGGVFNLISSAGVTPRYLRPATPTFGATIVIVGMKEFAGI